MSKTKSKKRRHHSSGWHRTWQQLRNGLVYLQRSRVVRFLSRCLAAPTRWLGGWLRTRKWRYLLQGSPAILTVCLVTCVLFAQTIKAPITDIERYRLAVMEAMAEKEWETADLWLRKLEQMGVRDNGTRFRAALVASELERPQRTRQIMHQLAPDEVKGYPEAHFWIAMEKGTWKRSEMPVLIHHLEAATESRFSALAHYELARAYAARKQYADALENLEYAVDFKPEVRFDMSDLYNKIGQPTEAQRQLEIAELGFSRLVERDPSDVQARLWWAKACTMQGRFPDAERVIQAGLEEMPDSRLNSALAELYAMLANRLRETDPDKLVAVLGLLQRSVMEAPNNPIAVSGLLQLLPPLRDKDPPAALQDALTDGRSTGIAHLLLSVYALNRRSAQDAAFHLEHAFGWDARMPQALNAVAVQLANMEKPHRQRAYELLTLALRILPQNKEFRATRGQIFLELGRLPEARADLEKAISGFQDHLALHAALIQVYDKQGEAEKADHHRERVRQILQAQRKSAVEVYGDSSE